MNIYEAMGRLSTKHLDTHLSYGTRIKPGNLRLESQKIVEFMGGMDEWEKCTSRTEFDFVGSGYEQVLTDATYSAQKTQMNRVVYSQLSVTTIGGTSYHIIKQYEDDKNGYGS